MSIRRGGLPSGTANISLGALTPPVLPPIGELAVPPVLPVADPHPVYPFQNLVFEGGGSKGIAYCGALKELEERGLYPKHVLRVAGTSSGSFLAAMLAVGYRADELRDLLFATDLVAIMKDARFGRLSEMVNLFTIQGFNPGFRLMDFLGELLAERTGSPDVTFKQVLERCGRELCVPITNITRMVTEYCHPKTTPDLPVRLAVGMSMSLPVLMQPYRLMRSIGSQGHLESDIYTDGGLLCNYPLHAFDGWWLSMQPEDTFVRRMRPLADVARFLHPTERFHPAHPGTLGFTVFDSKEIDITSAWRPSGAVTPSRPNTRLVALRGAEEAEACERQKMASDLEASVERLVHALDAVEQDGDGRVSAAEAADLFNSGRLTEQDAQRLFGTADVDRIMQILDQNGDGYISYDEILRFLDSHNIDLTARAMGSRRSSAGGLSGFMSNVFHTMLIHIRRSSLRHEDRGRTVPIDTDYIGTADFDLEDGDRSFLLDAGASSAAAFLDDWLENNT